MKNFERYPVSWVPGAYSSSQSTSVDWLFYLYAFSCRSCYTFTHGEWTGQSASLYNECVQLCRTQRKEQAEMKGNRGLKNLQGRVN